MVPRAPFAPLDLYVRTLDLVNGQDFIRVQLTPEWFALLCERAAACIQLGLSAASAPAAPSYGNACNTEGDFRRWSIEINSAQFRFIGDALDGGLSSSRWIGIQALDQAITCQANHDMDRLPDGFGLLADDLFCTEDEEVHPFMDEVCTDLPEVAAKQTERSMSEAITEMAGPNLRATEAAPRRLLRRGI